MSTMAYQITSLTTVYSIVYSVADQGKHQSSASLAFVSGIHRSPDEFPAEMSSNAENFSIWWRHHGPISGREVIGVSEITLKFSYAYYDSPILPRESGDQPSMITLDIYRVITVITVEILLTKIALKPRWFFD